MARLQTLIAEDEELARSRLTRLVEEHAGLELVSACRNGTEALEELTAHRVDIALLDIEMPGLNGIALSRHLHSSGATRPAIVFVTAHAQFAVDAFEVRATDYLLKPFDQPRFDKAMHAAMEHLRMQRAVVQSDRIRSLLDEPDASTKEESPDTHRHAPGRVVVRCGGRMQIVRSSEVDWIEADGRSCILHSGRSRHNVDGPLFEIAERLGEASFARVGRSAVINIERIAELQEMFKGNLIAVLKNGDEVAVSRRYRTRVMECLAGR